MYDNNSLIPQSENHLSQIGNLTSSINEILSKKIKDNPYTARITRDNPTAFVFLIDQSGSMNDEIIFNDSFMTKAEAVSIAVNSLLTELIGRCSKGNDIYHYFDIALIGYGREETDLAYSLFKGGLLGKNWATPLEMYENPLKQEIVKETKFIRGVSKEYEKTIKYWIEAEANLGTPMFAAFKMAMKFLQNWIINHKEKDCYPPIVINISDGEATDADNNELIDIAKQLKSLNTIDGNVLVINIHLSSNSNNISLFPRDKNEIPNDNYARLLFDMASDMPENYKLDIVSLKKSYNLPEEPPFKGMCFNADMIGLIRMLNIGTQTK